MSKTICRPLIAGLLLAVVATRGADTPPKFLGANSCADSSCHGGGGQNQNQFLVWSLKDFHSQRPAATLTTARAKQIADALQIKDATADARCTTCHAPLHDVPENLRGEDFKVSEGVSCESCHGPAENWIRSHTRTDYTHADRTATGMRDLQNLYVRANTCVACHQNVDADILKAGHPELIFELDGQSVAEPKHWSADKNGNGAQAWLVGQAVALREMSWQLAKETSPTENQENRWLALVWVLKQIDGADASLPADVRDSMGTHASNQKWADQLAHAAANIEWTSALSRKCLNQLLDKNHLGFGGDTDFSNEYQARRAERLVLALDRLVAALPELKNNEPVQASLNQLFKLAQSIPDFDPKQFADALEKFSAAVNAR
ncbi:MAG TPA: multiheme c-type cytochrome [Verrucomicrobiae bacterium]